MWSINLWQGFVVAVLLVFAAGGSWAVLWWMRAFPTRPTEIVTWGERPRRSSVTQAFVPFPLTGASNTFVNCSWGTSDAEA